MPQHRMGVAPVPIRRLRRVHHRAAPVGATETRRPMTRTRRRRGGRLGCRAVARGDRCQSADNFAMHLSAQREVNGTLPPLIHSRARGGERNVRRHQPGAGIASRSTFLTRGALRAHSLRRLCPSRDHGTGGGGRVGHRAAVGPPGQRFATGDARLHVCTRRRHQRRVHRLGAARHQLRTLARGTRTHGPPVRLRHRLGTRAAADHRRRGARGQGSRPVLGARPRPQCSGADGRAGQHGSGGPVRLSRERRRCQLRQGHHAALSGLRLDVRRRTRRDEPALHVDEHLWLLGSPGQHLGAVDDQWQPDRPDG